MTVDVRVDAEQLRSHVRTLFDAAGVDHPVSRSVARVLVEGDLLGYHTHGVLLARTYLEDLRAGRADGRVRDLPRLEPHAPVASVDCGYALGPHLVEQALAATQAVARQGGVGMLALARSHHIGCLAAYLGPMQDRDLVTIIMSSNPARASVLPHGGKEPVITPNPLAMRIPTETDPIILDISMSTVTNGAVARAQALGERMASPVLVDADGDPTDDPTGILAPGPGGILPLGGLDFGYKGFALGLLVETLTSGLAGHGRRDRPEGLGASVLVMSLSADRFGGADHLVAETQFLADAVRSSAPRRPDGAVRLPGAEALRRRRERLAHGTPLPADAVDSLAGATLALGLGWDLGSLERRVA